MFKNTLQFFGKVSMDTPVAQANEFTQFNQYAIGSKHKDESRFDHHAKLHSLQGLSLARNLPDVTGFLWEPIPDEAKVTPNNTSDSILGLLDQLAAANGVTPASSSSSSSSSAASPGSSTHVSKHNITKKKLGHMGYLLDKGFNTTLSKEEKTYREMMFFPRGWSGLPHVPVDLIGPGGHNALVQERESATVVALLTVAQHYVEKTTEPAEAVAQGISEFHEGSHARLEAMLERLHALKEATVLIQPPAAAANPGATSSSSSSATATQQEAVVPAQQQQQGLPPTLPSPPPTAVERIDELIQMVTAEAKTLADELHVLYKRTDAAGTSLAAASNAVNATQEMATQVLRNRSSAVARLVKEALHKTNPEIVPALRQMRVLPTSAKDGFAMGVDKAVIKSIATFKPLSLGAKGTNTKKDEKNKNRNKNRQDQNIQAWKKTRLNDNRRGQQRDNRNQNQDRGRYRRNGNNGYNNDGYNNGYNNPYNNGGQPEWQHQQQRSDVEYNRQDQGNDGKYSPPEATKSGNGGKPEEQQRQQQQTQQSHGGRGRGRGRGRGGRGRGGRGRGGSRGRGRPTH